MAYCSDCGGEVANSARFCRHCGTALGTIAPRPPATPNRPATHRATSASSDRDPRERGQKRPFTLGARGIGWGGGISVVFGVVFCLFILFGIIGAIADTVPEGSGIIGPAQGTEVSLAGISEYTVYDDTRWEDRVDQENGGFYAYIPASAASSDVDVYAIAVHEYQKRGKPQLFGQFFTNATSARDSTCYEVLDSGFHAPCDGVLSENRPGYWGQVVLYPDFRLIGRRFSTVESLNDYLSGWDLMENSPSYRTVFEPPSLVVTKESAASNAILCTIYHDLYRKWRGKSWSNVVERLKETFSIRKSSPVQMGIDEYERVAIISVRIPSTTPDEVSFSFTRIGTWDANSPAPTCRGG